MSTFLDLEKLEVVVYVGRQLGTMRSLQRTAELVLGLR